MTSFIFLRGYGGSFVKFIYHIVQNKNLIYYKSYKIISFIARTYLCIIFSACKSIAPWNINKLFKLSNQHCFSSVLFLIKRNLHIYVLKTSHPEQLVQLHTSSWNQPEMLRYHLRCFHNKNVEDVGTNKVSM